LDGYVVVDIDGDDAEGGYCHLEAIPTAFPPPDSYGGEVLTLCLFVFDLRLYPL
jgi:hypothetical protein